MNCGVYQIKHVATGRVYIGSSVNMRRRLDWHRNALRRGGHHSRKLQRAWDKYGEAAFEFSVLLVCSPEARQFYEQRLIDGWELVTKGWNCSKSAVGPVIEPTPEYRAKLSASLRRIAKKHAWCGEMLCISEISERSGVPFKLLDRRINECGWDAERATSEPVVEKSRKVAGFGKSQTFKDWALELGVNESTLRARVRRGESIERIARSQKRITVGELAAALGWAQPVVAQRIKRGWDVGDALLVAANAANRREFHRNARVSGMREIAL